MLEPSWHHPDSFRSIAYHKVEGTPENSNSPGVIFLGGLASDMEGTKAKYLEEWAKNSGKSFIRFDYTGHGRSSGEFLDGSIQSWFGDAVSVLDELTCVKQILVGSSMGGWIAFLLAKHKPLRVHSILGIAAAPDFTEDSMWEKFDKKQRSQIMENGFIYQESEYSEDPYKISKNLIINSRKCLILREKLELPFPVRLLQGTDDCDVPVDLAIKLLKHLDSPDAKLEIVKGANHSFSSESCLRLISQKIDNLMKK